jgi:F-type H+-transporting ATPase subunit a
MVLALEFPPINELVRWRDIFPSFNKVALICVLASLISIVIFLLASRQDGLKAPKGIRNFAESVVEFVENQIVMPTMGRQGLAWTPFVLSLFVFIYLCNLPGIIPAVFYMPATARLAIPLFLALVVWLVFLGVGIRHQGIGYFTHLLWPPGVPVALKPLVGVIEFVSTIVVRPFSLTIRLFANLFAGHILLVTFSLLTEELIQSDTLGLKPLAILPFFMLLFITAFEVLVGFLQAYIFAMLAGVYIGTSLESAH